MEIKVMITVHDSLICLLAYLTDHTWILMDNQEHKEWLFLAVL